MSGLADFHRDFGYAVIAANGIAGMAALVAWRVRSVRGRWLWWLTFAAEVCLMLQVVTGVALVADDRYEVQSIHQFYGFVAFITVGLAYSYRAQMKGRLELLYGVVGLFLMGLGIRALMEVTA